MGIFLALPRCSGWSVTIVNIVTYICYTKVTVPGFRPTIQNVPEHRSELSRSERSGVTVPLGGHEAAFQMCSVRSAAAALTEVCARQVAIAVSAHSMGIFDSCLYARTPMPAPVTLCATPLHVGLLVGLLGRLYLQVGLRTVLCRSKVHFHGCRDDARTHARTTRQKEGERRLRKNLAGAGGGSTTLHTWPSLPCAGCRSQIFTSLRHMQLHSLPCQPSLARLAGSHCHRGQSCR